MAPDANHVQQPMRCPFASGARETPQRASQCPFSAKVATAETPDNSASSSCSSGSTSTSADDSSSPHMHQAWQLRRPVLTHDPKLTRRQLRRLGRTWSLADVARHTFCDDGWVAVDGRVYDITEHITSHPGWDSGCRVSEVLSIIAHLGVDCSQEFRDIHAAYPVAYKQLQAYYIGDLAEE